MTAASHRAPHQEPASRAALTHPPLGCRFLGCIWNFDVDDRTVLWACARGCGGGGSHTCADALTARRLAARLQRGGPDAFARTVERIFHPIRRR